MKHTAEPCPCGSGHSLAVCCGPFLAGEAAAPSAEALMRSRYTAFCRRQWDYLARTQEAPFETGGEEASWLGLEVLAVTGGGEEDDAGTVEFAARYRLGGVEGRLHEISRFRREDGLWLYVDGEFPSGQRRRRVGRNDPCPCGSGRKYKKCCGLKVH